MLGTLTLKGIQQRNIFVNEDGKIFRLTNSWVVPPKEIKKYVLLQKRDDEYWTLLRDIVIEE